MGAASTEVSGRAKHFIDLGDFRNWLFRDIFAYRRTGPLSGLLRTKFA
jgi:hypothetical protein